MRSLCLVLSMQDGLRTRRNGTKTARDYSGTMIDKHLRLAFDNRRLTIIGSHGMGGCCGFVPTYLARSGVRRPLRRSTAVSQAVSNVILLGLRRDRASLGRSSAANVPGGSLSGVCCEGRRVFSVFTMAGVADCWRGWSLSRPVYAL